MYTLIAPSVPCFTAGNYGCYSGVLAEARCNSRYLLYGASGYYYKENNMKINSCSMKGFTLIEPLVVVLIIGILAAVALPQYNKAVERARGAQIVTFLNAYAKAADAWTLEHGCEDNEAYWNIENQLDTDLSAIIDQVEQMIVGSMSLDCNFVNITGTKMDIQYQRQGKQWILTYCEGKDSICTYLGQHLPTQTN